MLELTVSTTFLGVAPELMVASLGEEAFVVIEFTTNPGAGVNEIVGVAPVEYVFVQVPDVQENTEVVPSVTSMLFAPRTVTTKLAVKAGVIV